MLRAQGCAGAAGAQARGRGLNVKPARHRQSLAACCCGVLLLENQFKNNNQSHHVEKHQRD